MENAGKEDMPEDAERQGLGTPATRAAMIEKLLSAGFVERKGKSLVPTKDGINLAVILPDMLKSPLGVIYIGCVIFVVACSLTGVLLTSDRALFMFFLGGLCFSLSDNMLVVLSFGRNDSPYRNAVLHVLYYMAQIFIALSILFYTP